MAPLPLAYQRYHWILSWQMHIGKRNGVTPFLVYGGVVGGGFCRIFNSMIQGDLARKSPGQLLMINLIRTCCQNGSPSLISASVRRASSDYSARKLSRYSTLSDH
jgi:hypothetical protein